MTSETRHMIRKQILEISASSLPVAQWWDQRSGALLQDLISPCLQTCFDRVDATGEHIIIERLEIDLGVITEGNYRQLVPQRINAALEKALRDLQPIHSSIQGGREQTWPGESPGGNAEQKASMLDRQFNKDQSVSDTDPARRLRAEEAALEAFLFYLRHGVLPWWFDHPSDKSPPWDVPWPDRLNPTQLWRMLNALRLSTSAQRLIYCFDDALIGQIVTVNLDLSSNEPVALWKKLNLQLIETDNSLSRQLRMHYWRAWINAGLEGARKEQCVHMMAEFVIQHEILDSAAIRLLETDLKTPYESTAESLLKAVLDGVKRNVKQQSTEPDVSNRPPDSSAANDLSKADEHSTKREPERTLDEAEATYSHPEAILQQGVFTQGAGIVLLHPFLTELFEECGLWRKGDWCGQSSIQVAVHLLSWLFNGETPQPEYRLALQKLLCGMAIDEPLMKDIVIDSRQRESGFTLLKAVVQHWGVLGNTSPDGLREGFLRREGLLNTREQGWRLSIEKKAQDVLLGKLPWGISLIQLPWMEGQRIYVEWI
jgi:hypothetical protein